MRSKSKGILSAVLIGAMIAGSIQAVPTKTSVVLADELADAEDKKAEAQSKREEAEYKLSILESEKKDILEVIEELDSEIGGYQEKISGLKDERNILQLSAAVIENNLQDAYIAEAKQYESMKERIQYAYENGDAQYIEALFSIKNYATIMNQAEYIEKISEYDQVQLKQLLEIEKNISTYKEAISNNLDEVNVIKAQAEEEAEALQVMQSGKQTKLSEYNIEIADQEYTIEEMEAIEAEQDAAIAAIEAQADAVRAAAEAAAAAAAQAAAEQAAQQAEQAEEAANDGDTSSPTDAVPQQEEQPTVPTTLNTYTGGAFTWPLLGYYTITSSFGSREAPTEGASSFHKGVDIGCADGAPIVAAADGVVSYTGYFGGGGNTVIIDHGNGLCTLYMHMSGFAVGDGANVTAGTVIGYAGSTGISTGPHLHFAVRVGGEYADPMGYL